MRPLMLTLLLLAALAHPAPGLPALGDLVAFAKHSDGNHPAAPPVGTEQLRMRVQAQAMILDACPAWDASDAPFLDELDATLLPASGETCRNISHLELVFADIDADNDLDVIIVNVLSAQAESVWRNDGIEVLTRLPGNRFGAIPFRHGRMGQTPMPHPEMGQLPGVGASLPQFGPGVSPRMPVLHTAIARLTATPIRFAWLCLPGRAPPSLT